MDKLKSTVNYRQFDAPRASEQAWPVLEKMARAKSELSRPDTSASASMAPAPMAPAPVAQAPAAPIEVAPVAPPTAASGFAAEPPTNGSLFDRLQVDGRARGAEADLPKGAAFSRYGSAKTVEAAPQALSEIFERIGRKAL
ncbi:MAG: hypothetical protein AB1542_00850 [Pseudomonadota bacterium]|uniref:hypothetical protein n=1 Tax=Caulobacter sp. CCH9-E1 TaxID=1768768 RepID=UPI00082BBC94|nr:hypothetical protein [Caulobacter sp. CCH9-E1]